MGGSLGCLLGAISPYSPDAPVPLSYAFSGLAAIVALLLWLLGDRLGRPLLTGGLVLGVILISVIVASVATPQGAAVTRSPTSGRRSTPLTSSLGGRRGRMPA